MCLFLVEKATAQSRLTKTQFSNVILLMLVKDFLAGNHIQSAPIFVPMPDHGPLTALLVIYGAIQTRIPDPARLGDFAGKGSQ